MSMSKPDNLIQKKAMQITNEHNRARRLEGASDMRLIKWDQDLGPCYISTFSYNINITKLK